MSRRDRGVRRVRNRPPGYVETTSWPGALRPEEAPAPSLREQLERASLAARALLPLRFFFGATFVYAGLDKLLDPAFFNATNPASINAQLAAFARVSPLAPLVRLSEPFALPIGLLIAIAEIAIGLGAITGLAFRLAAAGGAILSLLFWLTASWTTHPFYYGPDLPYAFGWATLALAGDGGLLVPRFIREMGEPAEDDPPIGFRGGRPARAPYPTEEVSPARRQVLQAGALAAAALAVASLSVPIRVFRPKRAGDDGTALGAGGDASRATSATATAADPTAASPAGGGTASPAAPGGTANAMTIASVSAVDKTGAKSFRIPATAPASLPAGDPGIIVKLADGTYVAYDATCTHEGCRVGWDARDNVLLCPCHGAAFDPADHGAVLGGPANQPLLELPIVVDHAAGTITLQA